MKDRPNTGPWRISLNPAGVDGEAQYACNFPLDTCSDCLLMVRRLAVHRAMGARVPAEGRGGTLG